ncbi:MAG: hypothetical protein ACRDI2_22025, partial [Chloroflexota bacterium]
SEQAGLKRFVYHPDRELGAAEWSVLARLCGRAWAEDPAGYWPPGTAKPDSFSAGRRPPGAG